MVGYADTVWDAGVMSRLLTIVVAFVLLVLGGTTVAAWSVGPVGESVVASTAMPCPAHANAAAPTCEERGVLGGGSPIGAVPTHSTRRDYGNEAPPHAQSLAPEPGPPRRA